MDQQQHQQIDRYVIRRVLGSGAMGSVYAAWDPKLHREVALKLVPSHLSLDPKGRERFQREARAIAAVRHPNIVEIYDYSGTDSQHLYLVIEKLDGEDLFATLNRRGMMPEPLAAAVGHELCLALQVAHEAGIIHRDLKPENVFLNASGRVVLTDFGIVKAVRGDSAVDGYNEKTDVIGTPGFMAPELLSGRNLGPAIDIFALGALLYNITTQHLPFEGASPLDVFQAAAAGRYIDPRRYNPLLSEEFCAIINACLQASPKKRPRSAEVVRQALKSALEDLGVGDVRDDLHDYMANSEAYRQKAHARGISHVMAQIKVAAKDHDSVQLERYRKRLMALDPYNDEVGDLSGVSPALQARPRTRGMRALRHRVTSQVNFIVESGVYHLEKARRRLPSPWLVLIGILALTTASGTVLLALRHRHQAARVVWGAPPAASIPIVPLPVEPPAESAPSASTKRPVHAPTTAPASAFVEVTIVGGAATLMVDGKALGNTSHRSLQLAPGHHTFEVVKWGHGCKRIITLSSGDHLVVKADPRRKQINVHG